MMYGFNQVEIAYLAVIKYLDKLVASYIHNSNYWHCPGLASTLVKFDL